MRQTQLTTSMLGSTGMEITRIGFGAWVIGGECWEFGWRRQQDDEPIAAIHRALEGGVSGQVDPVLPGANRELTEEDLLEIKEALA